MSAPYRTDAAPDLLLAAFNGKVFAFDPESGRRAWSWDSGTSATVRLGVDGGRAYVLVRRRLVCLEIEAGRPVWEVDCIPADTLLVSGGFVFVAGAGEVACYAKDGTNVWHDELKGHGIGDVALAFKGVVAQADRQT